MLELQSVATSIRRSRREPRADGSLAREVKTSGFSEVSHEKFFDCPFTDEQVSQSVFALQVSPRPAVLLVNAKHHWRCQTSWETIKKNPQQNVHLQLHSPVGPQTDDLTICLHLILPDDMSTTFFFFLHSCLLLLLFFGSSTFVSAHRHTGYRHASTMTSSIRKLLQMPRELRRNGFCIPRFQ